MVVKLNTLIQAGSLYQSTNTVPVGCDSPARGFVGFVAFFPVLTLIDFTETSATCVLNVIVLKLN